MTSPTPTVMRVVLSPAVVLAQTLTQKGNQLHQVNSPLLAHLSCQAYKVSYSIAMLLLPSVHIFSSPEPKVQR